MTASLVEPGALQHLSFLAALGEYHREGLHTDLDESRLADPSAYAQWVDHQREAGLVGESTQQRDRVPHRILWWADGGEFLGRVRLDLVLNDELREFGGHLGYDVRPSARGCGHATALLAAALATAGRHGLQDVLLTCAVDDHASRKVIERNGGRLLDVSAAGRLRFLCRAG